MKNSPHPITTLCFKKNYIIITFFLFASLCINAQDSFENSFNGWANLTSGDQINWRNDSGGTPSGDTGPSSGSAGNWYMFIETSDGDANNGDLALLEKEFDLTNKQNAQLTFDYHMYGVEMGTLDAWVNDNGALTNVFSQSGNKGNTWNSSSVINLSAFDGKVIKIRFGATKRYRLQK